MSQVRLPHPQVLPASSKFGQHPSRWQKPLCYRLLKTQTRRWKRWLQPYAWLTDHNDAYFRVHMPRNALASEIFGEMGGTNFEVLELIWDIFIHQKLRIIESPSNIISPARMNLFHQRNGRGGRERIQSKIPECPLLTESQDYCSQKQEFLEHLWCADDTSFHIIRITGQEMHYTLDCTAGP